MLEKIHKWIIGGRSGKREIAFGIFGLWVFSVALVDVLSWFGYDASFIRESASAAMLPVFTWLGTAYGMEHFKPGEKEAEPDLGDDHGPIV